MSRGIPIGQQFSMLWIRQNILEKIVAFLWQVKMDQQKRGEFVMLVSSLNSHHFSSCLKVGDYVFKFGTRLRELFR
jgi:hypothetical protein